MALQKHFFLYFMSKVTSYPADYQTSPTLFELEPVAGKKVTVDFSASELSSLGGLALVSEYEKSSSRIIERIKSCIKDPRWEPIVIHSQTEMLSWRIYQIMAGFEDADDCDRLCSDGILKMCAGRSASDEMDLASQPTMTHLENRLSRKELFDIGEAFIDDFIASYESEPDSIIIDADDTNADTYGAQQLTLFNAYYGEYCYMPLLLFEGRSGKLILPVLRPGRGNKAINIAGLLKRLILKLRKKWKHTQIIVRGDSHFCSHDFMDWATDRQDGIHFISGLAGNVKLKRKSANWLDTAIASYEATGEEVRIFHSFMYKASSWKHQQRVVVKIEVNNLGTNVRYVVTDFSSNFFEMIDSLGVDTAIAYGKVLMHPVSQFDAFLSERSYRDPDYINDIMGTQCLRYMRYQEAEKYLRRVSTGYRERLNVKMYLRYDPFSYGYQKIDMDATYVNDKADDKYKFAKEMASLERDAKSLSDVNRRCRAKALLA